MPVITVSRQLGSLGDEISQKVAQILHYDLIQKEKIAKALATYGLPEPDLEIACLAKTLKQLSGI